MMQQTRRASVARAKTHENRLEVLRTSLLAWRETIFETAISEAGLIPEYVDWQFRQALQVLDNYIDHHPSVPAKPAATETVAILLPYNILLALPVALAASGVVAGRRVALRFSSEFPKTSQLVAGLIEEALPSVRVAQDSGRQFVLRHLRRPETTVLLVFGRDDWACAYEDLVRRCDRKKFIFQGPAKDPFIVLEDADLEKAASDAVRGALFNAGQACLCPKRFYVAKKIADQFTDLVVHGAKTWESDLPEASDGLLPIVNQNVVRRLRTQLEDALARGAKIQFGGRIVPRPHGPGYLVEPTVLTAVNHGMLIMRDETFGPVIPIRVVTDAEEAAAMAEDSRYGWTASVYGDRPELLQRLRLSHGLVCANSLSLDSYHFDTGVGGFKNSGWIWERSAGRFCRREGQRRPYHLEFQHDDEHPAGGGL
jgi:acyl-CoA reductase-like NAD-dependent aldehyde dehydrogenase